MKVSRSQIVNKIHSLWPDLIDGHREPGNIFIPRGEYWAPSKEDFQTFISQDWTGVIRNIDYDIKRWACSNFAAALAVQADLFVLWQQSLNKFEESAMLEWAVMEAWGTKFDGKDTSHAINMIYMDDNALWFFEPQTDSKAWLADPELDTIHFVKL